MRRPGICGVPALLASVPKSLVCAYAPNEIGTTIKLRKKRTRSMTDHRRIERGPSAN